MFINWTCYLLIWEKKNLRKFQINITSRLHTSQKHQECINITANIPFTLEPVKSFRDDVTHTDGMSLVSVMEPGIL